MKYRGATGGVVEVTTVVVVDIDMLLTFVLLIAIRKTNNRLAPDMENFIYRCVDSLAISHKYALVCETCSNNVVEIIPYHTHFSSFSLKTFYIL